MAPDPKNRLPVQAVRLYTARTNTQLVRYRRILNCCHRRGSKQYTQSTYRRPHGVREFVVMVSFS